MARGSLTVVIALLVFAFLADVSMMTVGGLATADTYYLPLQKLPLGEHQREVEDILIETHGKSLRYQRRLWLVIHGAALVCALFAMASVSKLRTA